MSAEYPASESVVVGGGVDYDPEDDFVSAEIEAAIALDEQWAVSGALGADVAGLEPGDTREISWDVGVTRSIREQAWMDLRYYDSNLDRWAWSLSVGVDF